MALEGDGCFLAAHSVGPTARQESPRPPLQRKRGPAHPAVALTVKPAFDVLLDHDAAVAQLLRAKLLQVGHLPRAEEQLGLAELVLVLVVDQLGDDVLTGGAVVVLPDVSRVAQDAVADVEIVVCPSERWINLDLGKR